MKKIILAILCLFLLSGCQTKEDSVLPDSGYEEIFFNNDIVHDIDISISQKDLDDMFENAIEEEWKRVDITIDGNKIKDVGLRTKGQSSLSISASQEDNIRFSLKLKFDKYKKGQTYYGLDEVALNASFQDTTFLKEYLAYDAFRFMDVPAGLTNFSFIKFNGNDYGLYVGVESVDESYLNRNFPGKDGVLYKPFVHITYNEDNSEDEFFYPDFIYREDLDDLHYKAIFDNVKSGDITDEDKQRLIESMRRINNGDLDGTYNKEKNFAYFAVNNFLKETDSYPTTHPHNFYVYEINGEINMIPWDYNSTFGVFKNYVPNLNSGQYINQEIDRGVSPTMDDSTVPLWSICIDDRYKDEYINVYKNFLDGYLLSGLCLDRVQSAHELIASYIKRDFNKYFSDEQCDIGYQTFLDMIKYRTQSIDNQIDTYLTGELHEPISSDINVSNLGWSDYFTSEYIPVL